MKLAVDFHIHSGLSPCADNDMTPNNIVNMAVIKGLDVIAITDHNSTLNLQSFINVGKRHNILCIPGVEVTTKEEVHLIGLFKSLDEAGKFQDVLDTVLPKIKNNIRFFGNQYIYNEEDDIIEEHDILLMNAIKLTVEETVKEIKKVGGIVIPAHINRKSFSILTNLGFISSDLGFKAVEITSNCDYTTLIKTHPYLKNYKKIKSSDAHHLGAILEREFFINIASINAEDIFNYFA